MPPSLHLSRTRHKIHWDLLAEAITPGKCPDASGKLLDGVAHGALSIRGFMTDLAWLVQSRIQPFGLANRLLWNVGDRLLWWNTSPGLCSMLFPDEETFWAYAESYSPPARYEEQYRQRIAEVKERGIGVCTAYFHQLERSIRNRAMDYTMRIPIDRSGTARK